MKRRMIYIIIAVVAALIVYVGHVTWVSAGKKASGERLARVMKSPQYRNGEFRNLSVTPMMTGDNGMMSAMWQFLFGKTINKRPDNRIPVVKTDLKSIPRNEEVVVWLGHSSLYIQTGGKRFLFDPVLTNKMPVYLFMRPFKGTDTYTPDDIPDVDVLVITHDHWDHLDYATVKALMPKVGLVACTLGIGEDFEYWGYPKDRIHDLDWGDSLIIDNVTLRCLPARHFSGRLLSRNQTLWGSYLIDGKRRIYVSGDSGYDTHFAKIGEEYPGIDLAIMENGQYSLDWRYIHMMPTLLPKAIGELGPRRVMSCHNSKFALSTHTWTAPLDSIYKNSKGKPWHLITPRIGESLKLDMKQTFRKWW